MLTFLPPKWRIIDMGNRRQVRVTELLDRLMSRYGEAFVADAFSAAVEGRLLERLRSRFGESTSEPRIATLLDYPRRLLYTEEKGRVDWENQTFPGEDHSDVREKDGERTFTTEPYGISWENLAGMVDYCRKNGLQADVSTGSPHNATSCVLVTVRRASKETP